MIAKSYLREKLKSDTTLIKIDLKKKFVGILEEKRELINAHLRWMQRFIATILGEPTSLELDSSQRHGLMLSKAQYGHFINMDHIDEKTILQYAGNITLSQQLRLAFMDNHIMPWFQPILNMKTKEITKYEALMRVRDLEGNVLEPADFLNVLRGIPITIPFSIMILTTSKLTVH